MTKILNPQSEYLSDYEKLLEDEILGSYRVWADGTVQEVSKEPYSCKSDDYMIVRALDEEHAYQVWEEIERKSWGIKK